MSVLYTNNAKTTLSASLNNSATSLSVASSSGFPSLSGSHYFYATLDDNTNLEVVKVTAVSGTTWTVVRGQDNTSATAFSSGDTIELRLNAALLTDVVNDALASSFTRQDFTGNGSTTAFTLNKTPGSESDLIVFIEGVFQNQADYTLSGTTLTFDEAPASSRKIVVYHVSASVSGDSLALNTFSGDGSTTAFTMSVDPLYENNTMVFIDGVYQNKSTYSTSGTTLTFDAAPANGTSIDVTTHTQQTINVPVDGSVSTAKIAADAVTGAKIADDAINSEHYTDGSIDTAHIANLQVTTGKLAADAVTAAKLADDSVVTANITDDAVTTAKIADDQITLAKLAGLARGKIIYGDSSGNPAALALGSNGQVLKSDGTDIAWATDATVAALTSEEVQDIVGAMFSSNTETGITATYQDADGTVDLVIGDDTIVSSMLDTNIDIAGTFDVTGATTLDSTVKAAGTVLSTSAAQVNSTSAGGFGFASNNTAFYSFGEDASTAGSYTFQNLSNNASVNITAMKIAADGKVGIGTASPASILHIEGDTNSYAAAPVLYFGSTSTANAAIRDWAIGPADDSYGNFHIFRGTSTGSDPIGNDGRVVTISSSGNLGIGTTNPVLKLSMAPAGDGTKLGYYDDGTHYSFVEWYNNSDADTNFYKYDGSGGDYSFTINNSEKIRFLSTGGITFNGDSATANALDDYETGSWTPDCSTSAGDSSIGVTVNYAKYIKIGDLVFVSCYLSLSVNTAGSGAGRITGLPFAVGTNSGYHIGGLAHANAVVAQGTNGVAFYAQQGQSYVRFVNVTDTGNVGFVQGGTKYLMMSVVYTTQSY